MGTVLLVPGLIAYGFLVAWRVKRPPWPTLARQAEVLLQFTAAWSQGLRSRIWRAIYFRQKMTEPRQVRAWIRPCLKSRRDLRIRFCCFN